MVTEADLDLIDGYLDNALTSAHVATFDRRLAAEPALAAALADARASRATRAAIWRMAQPDPRSANVLASRIVSLMRRQRRAMAIGHWTRVASAIAACVLLGFAAGWIGRGRAPEAAGNPLAPGALAQAAAASRPTTLHSTMSIEYAGKFVVPISTDDNGKVLMGQPFESYKDAQQFARELAAYESRVRDLRQGRLVSVGEDKTQFEF